MRALRPDSHLARALGRLAAAISRHPQLFIWPQVVIFLFCVVYTLEYLRADMDRDNLVGPNQKYHQNFLALQKEFPQPDDLVVVVESDDIEKNRQFVERIAAKIQAETNLFKDVFYQQNLSVMGNKGLLYASNTDLVQLQGVLRTADPFLRQFTLTTNLVSLFQEINTAFRTAPREETDQTRSLVKSLPALTRIVSQANDALNHPGTPPSPNIITLLNNNETNLLANYITFANGKLFLLTVHAPNDALNDQPPIIGSLLKDAITELFSHQAATNNDDVGEKAIKRLRVLIRQTREEVPGINVGLTGEPVLDYDEMMQAQKDTTFASILSLALCALIFIYGYNETGRPIKATLCLVIGLGYTLAFTTFAVGHLNILTITFVPMLIGLAIDFGVHLITRYEEELRHGQSSEQALAKAMMFTGQGILVGALTTAGAFLAMALTHFKGIQEMGIICGGGLLVCLIPMMTMLPALLLRGRQNALDSERHEDETRARIENVWLKRPAIVMGITVTLCLVALLGARKLYFDYNLIQMQSPTLPSVVFEKKLVSSKSLLFAAVVADSLTNAVALQQRIEKLPTVAETEPPFYKNFLDPDQAQKLDSINRIKTQIADIDFKPPDLRPVDISALTLTLYGLYGYLGNALVEVGTNDPALFQELSDLRDAITSLRRDALAGGPAAQAVHAEKLGEYQLALFNDLRGTFGLLKNQDTSRTLEVDDLPPALHHRFVGAHGKFLIQVYPKEDVWQRAPQERFISELRTIDPNVTGTPVQLYEYETLLRNSYIQAAWYSLAAIALMVLFHFRSLTAVVLSLIPVAIGTLWLAGIMGFAGIPVNLANIMTLPLVIGIGVTNGIHILNRYAEEGTPDILSRSTGKAVLVSGLTAIAGFGSLILAKHQGIYSLGCMMATGIATCMIAALTFLPALLNLIGARHPLIKKPSADKKMSTPGQEEPR
jgi:hopanoid biosynthesis associated RND transporter like protein HpnN